MEVVVSAPGKVLITGGYLILERPNAGLVVSTNARFYAIVKPLYEEHNQESWAWSWTDVKVSSPQLSREATYKLSLIKSVLQCTSSRDTENPFVENALQFAVAAARSIIIEKGKKDALEKLLLQGLDITILGCNDFYSYRTQIEAHGLPLTRETLASFPPFSSIAFNVEDLNGAPSRNYKPEIAKTGLGSSAAMTTSVVAALLHYLGVVDLRPTLIGTTEWEATNKNLGLVHIIAQSAHCLAQGKVGSGFDISAAVYGSQCYVRFSPSVLSSAQVGGNFLPDVVSDILKGNWDHEISRFSLPPLMNLLLGEPGTGGSSTPSMVGSVKQWQKADPDNSVETWRMLHCANAKLEAQLKLLSKFAEGLRGTYENIINICSGFTHEKVPCVHHFEIACVSSTRTWLVINLPVGHFVIHSTSLSLDSKYPSSLTISGNAGLYWVLGKNIDEFVEGSFEKSLDYNLEASAQQQIEHRGDADASKDEGNVDLVAEEELYLYNKWMEQVVDRDEEAIVKTLLETRVAFMEIRSRLQYMGLAAGVPIEPESQTRLLDTTMNLEGVLLAGVPGAGGFDAVFAIILGEATDGIAKTWSSFGVLPLLVEEDSRGLCLESGDPRTRRLASVMSSIKIN